MLALLLTAIVCLACGSILGIVDCKKTYGIPHNAKPEEGSWFCECDMVEVDEDGTVNS